MGRIVAMSTNSNGIVYDGFVALRDVNSVRADTDQMLALVWFDGEPDLYLIHAPGWDPSKALASLERYYLVDWPRDRFTIQTFIAFPTFQAGAVRR